MLTGCQPSLGSKLYPLSNEWALEYLSPATVGGARWFGMYEAEAR